MNFIGLMFFFQLKNQLESDSKLIYQTKLGLVIIT
jgi:hypothetical protein